MISKINSIVNIVTNKYLIEVCFLEKETPDAIPVGKEHVYLVTDKNGVVTDYTKDPTQATCFDFVLGYLLVKKLSKNLKTECPNLSISLISVADANFINDILPS